MHIRLSILALIVLHATPSAAQTSVFLEELTWTEVREAVNAGTTTAIIPTGGTEQNGPHMVLGKHNLRVKLAAGEIAKRLRNALVAPVIAYVPEGDIDPPTGHMRMAGTITVPPDIFGKVVEFAARSLRAHGFTDIALVGDSGGNQAPTKAVAEMLNKEWASTPVRVLHLNAYYEAATVGFHDWLLTQVEKDAADGTHAGLGDTSLQLAVAPAGVRRDKLAPGKSGDGTGVNGDPRKASPDFGAKGFELTIEAAVRQFRVLQTTTRK